jgi:hypothetical protein
LIKMIKKRERGKKKEEELIGKSLAPAQSR